jgi:uncharacterized protein
VKLWDWEAALVQGASDERRSGAWIWYAGLRGCRGVIGSGFSVAYFGGSMRGRTVAWFFPRFAGEYQGRALDGQLASLTWLGVPGASSTTMPKTRCLTGHGTHSDNRDMDREQVVATLREHEVELRAAGVIRLSLFGSTARGEQRPDSDIDLLAAFDNTRRISLLDVAGIELRIARMLGRPVELVEEGMVKARVRKNAESEAVRAF